MHASDIPVVALKHKPLTGGLGSMGMVRPLSVYDTSTNAMIMMACHWRSTITNINDATCFFLHYQRVSLSFPSKFAFASSTTLLIPKQALAQVASGKLKHPSIELQHDQTIKTDDYS